MKLELDILIETAYDVRAELNDGAEKWETALNSLSIRLGEAQTQKERELILTDMTKICRKLQSLYLMIAKLNRLIMEKES